MTKKIFMVVMMVLFCTASAMATVNEKGKIYIKPVAMLPDGTSGRKFVKFVVLRCIRNFSNIIYEKF